MRHLFYDFETLYTSEYSLRKMTPIEYILDPRFEALGCAFQWGVDGKPFWVDGPDLQAFFDSVDPSDVHSWAHNALFDATIAAARYGFIPRLMGDTLGVSRAMLGHLLRSLSLDSVAKHLNLGTKTGALPKVMGMGFAQLKWSPLYDEFVDYALNDVALCAGIFKQLVLDAKFPASELILIDSIIRAVVQPQLELDATLLGKHLAKVQQAKEEMLARAALIGGSKDAFMSNDKFADLLRSVGVEPPTKISPLTGKTTYAFAKSDHPLVELLEHPDPNVQVLVATRLGVKSTIEETRTQRFLNIASLSWPDGRTPKMPFPLKYGGAHTHRLSGDWQLNMQNLPARSGGAELRYALKAPPDHVIYAPDASQIEARGVAAFCGQTNLVQQFESGEDVYASFGSMVFGFPVNKAQHPVERFVGKTGVLGLGYAVGKDKFVDQVKIQSRSMLGQEVVLSIDEGQRVVTTYRTGYPMVPAMWKTLDRLIPILAFGGRAELGPLVFEKGRIILPNGLALKYEGLEQTSDGWRYVYGGITKRLYGGALLENIIQALARIVVMDAAVRIRKITQISFAGQVHDELLFVVPKLVIEGFEQIALEEMCRRPSWLPTWPLAAEGKPGLTYGDT